MKTTHLIRALLAALALSASAGVVSYTYDPAGRLISADSGSGKSISYAYDNAGNLLASAQPTPGLIVAGRTGSQLTLAWPISPGGFVLQSASSVGAGSVWNNVGATVTQSGDFNYVTVTAGGTTFYRLKK